jgi:hypothetical protein
MSFDWLGRFQHQVRKEGNYAEKTLAAYRLGIKARGSIAGVRIEPSPDCCDLARSLPAGKIYSPDDAPHLPLANCPQGLRCGCVYRPAMTYENNQP